MKPLPPHDPTSGPLRATSLVLIASLSLLLVGFGRADTGGAVNGNERLAQAEETDLLALTPADSTIVMIVPNLRAASNRLALLDSALGLSQPALADLLGFLQQLTGAQAGLREDGPLYVLFGSVASMTPGRSPSTTILVPVSDYAAFLGNYGVVPSAVSEVVVPGSPMPYFTRQVGGFAAMSPDRASVEAVVFPPTTDLSTTIGSLGRSVLSTSDFTVIVNVTELSPMLRPLLSAMWDSLELIYASTPEVDAQSLETMRTMLRLYRSGFDALLRDSSIATLGFDVDENGVGMTMTTQFREGTPLAAIFTEGGAPGDLLLRLPDRPYLMAVAGSMQGIDIGAIVDAIGGVVPTTGSGFAEMWTQAVALMRDVDSFSMAWYRPEVSTTEAEGASTPNLFDFLTIYHVSDADAFLTAMRSYMETMNSFSFPLGPMPDETGAMVSGSATYTSNYEAEALQIESYRVDRFSLQVTMPPEYTSQLEHLGPWGSLVGFTGYSGFIAAGGDRVVMSTDLDETKFRSDLAQSETTTGLGLREELATVRSMALVDQPSMEAYIDVGQIAELVQSLSSETSPAAEPAAPADLLPIGMFASVRDHGLVGRLVVPMSAARFLTDLFGRMSATSTTPI